MKWSRVDKFYEGLETSCFWQKLSKSTLTVRNCDYMRESLREHLKWKENSITENQNTNVSSMTRKEINLELLKVGMRSCKEKQIFVLLNSFPKVLVLIHAILGCIKRVVLPLQTTENCFFLGLNYVALSYLAKCYEEVPFLLDFCFYLLIFSRCH